MSALGEFLPNIGERGCCERRYLLQNALSQSWQLSGLINEIRSAEGDRDVRIYCSWDQ